MKNNYNFDYVKNLLKNARIHKVCSAFCASFCQPKHTDAVTSKALTASALSKFNSFSNLCVPSGEARKE